MKLILTILLLAVLLVGAGDSEAKDLPKQPYGVMVGALFADGVTSVAWAPQLDINYTTFGALSLGGELSALFNRGDRKIVRIMPAIMHKSMGKFHVGLGAGLWHYLQDGNDVDAEAYRVEVGFQPFGFNLVLLGEGCPDEKDYFTAASFSLNF